jgi:hypothetical protein
MTRKTNGPKDPKDGAGKHGLTPKSPNSPNSPNAGEPAGKNGADIIPLTSSAAFDIWLDRQTKKLVQASSDQANEALIDLIRSWPGNNPKKGPGKITD